jgi:2-keto-4-pentenoate hydratase/2-oxohepta-3-ene-1,7-dioic acid hydratase in catechol pathway
MKLSIPGVPTLFIKPSTALADPWPAPTVLPKITQADNTGDYESEMVIVIGRDAKDVSEADALDYVLGYTAANDVSSRTSQMNQSQWCFSKGFDTSCPIGEFPSYHTSTSIASCQMRVGADAVDFTRTDSRFLSIIPGRQQVQNPWTEERNGTAGLSSNV